MALTTAEKQKILDYIEVMDDATRKATLSSFDRFTNWLKISLNTIYQKVSAFLSDIWSAIRNIFN